MMVCFSFGWFLAEHSVGDSFFCAVGEAPPFRRSRSELLVWLWTAIATPSIHEQILCNPLAIWPSNALFFSSFIPFMLLALAFRY